MINLWRDKMKVKDLIERLQKEFDPDQEVCAPIWVGDDVIFHMKYVENEIVLTSEDAENIIGAMDYGHDATVGVNWDVLQCYIDSYISENGL